MRFCSEAYDKLFPREDIVEDKIDSPVTDFSSSNKEPVIENTETEDSTNEDDKTEGGD